MPDASFPNTSDVRRRMMAAVRGKNTKPEMVVRRLAHAEGYRFRLHRRDLPGSPDLVFPSRRSVIFVHGCFWHRHEGCQACTSPKDNHDYWQAKFERNKERDRQNLAALSEAGWRTMVVWECETRRPAELLPRLHGFLDEIPPAAA